MAQAPFEFTGRIYQLSETVQVGTNNTDKREVVVMEVGSERENMIKFDFFAAKAGKLNNFERGDLVTVTFYIKSNKYKDKYFTNLNGWNIIKVGDEEEKPVVDTRPMEEQLKEAANNDDIIDMTDDLPF